MIPCIYALERYDWFEMTLLKAIHIVCKCLQPNPAEEALKEASLAAQQAAKKAAAAVSQVSLCPLGISGQFTFSSCSPWFIPF
jgi:hypothetical protein